MFGANPDGAMKVLEITEVRSIKAMKGKLQAMCNGNGRIAMMEMFV
jgi:hypothetical protein